jgi:hypothetical protein
MHYLTTKPRSCIATTKEHSEISVSLTIYSITLKGCEKAALGLDSAARNRHSQNCNIIGIIGATGCCLLLLYFVIFVAINTAYHI